MTTLVYTIEIELDGEEELERVLDVHGYEYLVSNRHDEPLSNNPHNFTCVQHALHEILCNCCVHYVFCKLNENNYDGCQTYKYAEDNTEDPFLLKRFE